MFDLIFDISFSVSLPPFSCPPCLQYLRPYALILLRPWRNISQVLTYLLTYLLNFEWRCCSWWSKCQELGNFIHYSFISFHFISKQEMFGSVSTCYTWLWS